MKFWNCGIHIVSCDIYSLMKIALFVVAMYVVRN